MKYETEFTIADLNDLPPTLGLETAAKLLGIGRTKAYTMARCDDFPVPVLRPGRNFRVPTLPVLRLLGVEIPASQATPSPER
ncbi:hypothetical protein ABIA31_002875 [Catenulispora sp. MAP5-51]|uniref:DNA-binding protein n=1 Tax=Catenulispora sp. MAP5-51 TaxID=3156298 RepID=UPI00351117F7